MLTLTHHARARMAERQIYNSHLAQALAGRCYHIKRGKRELWCAGVGRRVIVAIVDPVEHVILTVYWATRSDFKTKFNRKHYRKVKEQ